MPEGGVKKQTLERAPQDEDDFFEFLDRAILAGDGNETLPAKLRLSDAWSPS